MTDMTDFTEHMRTEMAATERRLDYIANQRRQLDEEETALRQVIQGFAAYVAETVSAWHQANHEVNNAWRAIPRQDRPNLRPPQDAT